jgi:hypothetical protein
MKKSGVTNQTNSKVSRRVLIITFAVLFPMTAICVGIACGRVTLFTRASPGSPLAERKDESSSDAANRGQQGGRDEVRIELTNNGFMPAEVTHSAGIFAIAIENTSARDDYTLRLKAEDGTVLKEVQVQKGSTAWTVSLQPGPYVLTEANHQQWICRISIQ